MLELVKEVGNSQETTYGIYPIICFRKTSIRDMMEHRFQVHSPTPGNEITQPNAYLGCELLDKVPMTYKMHFIAVWTFFAFYPFSRLVHGTSAPLTYLYRTWILFRRRCEGF